MPSPEPAAVLSEDGAPVSDDLLGLLYRSGENPVLAATMHEWRDSAAVTARMAESARAAGHGGVGYLLDSIDAAARGKTVAHREARLRVDGRDRYRVDYLFDPRPGARNPRTIACDGERRWEAYEAVTVVGPAWPLPHEIANLADSSWLLRCRLSGGTPITYRGRAAYQLTAAKGAGWPPEALMFFPADVIVDAELGCLLRLISYAGDSPASWWELRDVSASPGEPGEFQVPPDVRTVEETGNPFADAAASMPGAAGHAVRTAVDVVKRTTGVVSAARGFMDDLLGGSRR
jgi:hypothetical protein